MRTIGSYGCETIQMSVGPDQLFVESVPAHVFTEQEEATLLGESYEHWLNAGECAELGFLLPYASSFAPHARTQDSVLSIEFNTAGSPINAATADDDSLIGEQHPFGGFHRASLAHCQRARSPLYFNIDLTLRQSKAQCARLLLPSVNDDDRIARIDIIQRTSAPGEAESK